MRVRRQTMLTVILPLACIGLAGATAAALGGLRYFYLEHLRQRLVPVNTGFFAQANQALPPPTGRRLVLFGDSRASQLSLIPPGDWDVVNRGIAGETSAQMRYRFAADVLALRPRLVVIIAGINDLVAASALPNLAREATASLAANLDSFVTEARAAGVAVMVLTVVRPGPVRLLLRPVWSDRVFGLVDEVNAHIRALAGPQVTVIDADHLLAAGAPELPARYARGDIGLTAEADEILTGAIIEAMPPAD